MCARKAPRPHKFNVDHGLKKHIIQAGAFLVHHFNPPSTQLWIRGWRGRGLFLRTHRYQWTWSGIYLYKRNIWLKSIGAWATMVTTTTTARTTTMRTTGRCERGWWNGGGRGGNSKLYCLKFCFNQRKTYPENVDLVPCLPAKTTCGHARCGAPRGGTNKNEECKLNGMLKRNIETYENCENRWKPLWKLLLNIWKLENW